MGFRKKYIIGVCVVFVLGIACGCSKKVNNGNEKYIDLSQYYGVKGEGTYGIAVEGEPAGTAVTVNDTVYLPQEAVAAHINSKFFYDEENNKIRYTTPSEIITEEVDKSGGKVITYDGQVYLELKYVMENSEVTYKIEESPKRISVFTEMGNIVTYKADEDIKLRETDRSDSSVMTDIKQGQTLYLKEYGDEWSLVVTESGIMGYVRNDEVKEGEGFERVSSYKGEEYTHIVRDEKICLGWHQMTNAAGNDAINEKIKNANGLNVISPTWFAVTDNKGGISSLGSKKYVKTAHDNGLEVWALINDFETDENGNYYIRQVLGSTQSRANLIANLINEVDKYDIDGINIDFENISLEYGQEYVQFIRELSVECRKKAIVLSADLYVPMSYNQYYGREDIGEVLDYVIIMGYDEHWGGGDAAGSVASLTYVRNGINNTIKSVDADRVINAIPFYTRIWSETPEGMSDGSGVFVEDPVNGNYYLGSRAVGMEAAENALADNGVEKYWLEDIGQYYGEYTKDGVLYRVWIEDEKSIELKLKAMEEAGLAGVACWQLGFEKPEIWTVIQGYLK